MKGINMLKSNQDHDSWIIINKLYSYLQCYTIQAFARQV